MLFMVVERYKNQDALAVYRRAAEQGRMMPEGLTYVESWVEANFNRCFQLVECEDAALLQAWIVKWSDLVEMEIVPVVHSHETSERLRPLVFPEDADRNP
jgi:hypothetical protein